MARKKRNTKRRSTTRLVSRIRTSVLALLLGGISAAVLCRCLDEGHPNQSNQLLRIAHDAPQIQDVDVGTDETVDPTLLHERELILAEVPTDTEEIIPPEPDAGIDEADAGAPPSDDTEQEDFESRFPMYAVAYHFHTQIRSEPRADARVISYARRGSTFRVSERATTKGCRRGWHELSVGGFICDGEGVNVSNEPVSFTPAPPAADLGSDLPYDYKYAKQDNTPEYWRIPTSEEAEQVVELFKRIQERNKQGVQAGRLDDHDTDSLAAVLARAAELVADAGADHIDGGIVEPSADSSSAVARPVEVPAPGDGGLEDPFALPPFVHLRMAKGYFVSTDDQVAEGDVTYQRTVRGRFVPADRLYPAKPSNLAGVLLDDQTTLPLVFVFRGGVKLLRRHQAGGPLKAAESIARYDHFSYLGQIKRKGKRYVQVGEESFLPLRAVTIAEAAPPPADLKPGERWIDVNLKHQTLVAYEGETPVFATLIASGRDGFETPEGSFRIYSKHVTVTMDDPTAGEEAYSIEDVPWTQYFDEGFALHAAFWHNRFGRVRSHGCVNLSPADARRLFAWTGPHLGQGLHGIVATRDNPGTRILVRK